MKITQYVEPEVEITQRIAYSVSALMKLNIISEVITTDNANLLPMHENKVYMLKTTVVSGGFGQRVFGKASLRSLIPTARCLAVATVLTMIEALFGQLYG